MRLVVMDNGPPKPSKKNQWKKKLAGKCSVILELVELFHIFNKMLENSEKVAGL
jgi:hypothetical protein